MRILLLFCALGALFGCRTVSEPSGTAIALFCSTYQGAKTESLTVGEEVAVFAGPEGTEDYFLEAAQFIVGSDGRSLTYGSTVYYPDPTQAVRFLAYFPYHKGTFSVPTDQSTATALKQADLCGATASTTPVATPVALEFRHLMARLVITTNEPTTRIVFPNAVASGVLHAATAKLVLADTRSDIWTDKNELIVPVQPLSRLVLAVANVEYVFDGSVVLEAGKTTTLDLTLHPDTHTATLSGSSVTDWVASSIEGNLTQAVSNVLTIHWAPTAHPLSSVVDRIVCTINGADYAVSNGIVYANNTFTVPFASETLRYPYTISKIAFYRGATSVFPACADLLGSMIYKSGASTVGIKDLLYNSILIDDLWWAAGNLVASNAKAGAHGLGGCKVGEPMDGGLYFQFGSLIGYKGGDQANGGTGVGLPQATNGTYWNGAAVWRWDNEAMVWPTELSSNPTAWPQATSGTAHNWYFSGNGVSSGTINSTDVANGVGDPCTYYLGGPWRLPTTLELASITGLTGSAWVKWTVAGVTGRWVTAGETFGGVSVPGAWFGRGLSAGTGTPTATNLFFSAPGYRYDSDGSFSYVTSSGGGWSSSVYGAELGLSLHFSGSWVSPQNITRCSGGFPVRCVSDVAP